jgi:hypothetical protein
MLNKEDWVNEQHEKYKVNNAGKMPHAQDLLNDAEKCYICECFYGSIFCTHSAISSFLMQKTADKVKVVGKKKKEVRAQSVRELLHEKQISFLSHELKAEILKFSRIRGNLEHPKSQLETRLANWGFDVELFPEEETTGRYRTTEEIRKNGLYFEPEKTAQKGLLLYYRMINEYLTSLEKRCESRGSF